MKLPWRRKAKELSADDWVAERDRRDAARRQEVLRLPVVPLRLRGSVRSPEAEDVLVSVGVGPDGEAVAVWATPAEKALLRSVTTREGWAWFPNSTPPSPVSARITRHAPDLIASIALRDVPIAHPNVQPLPGDRILLVGTRCYWRAEGPEHNAFIIDPEGAVEAQGTFGDGISSVLTTPTGDSWVGYFDEGVFGNYGWGAPDGPEPIGSCGIARWNSDLENVWRYPYDQVLGSVDDCYALNVDGETAWACYYSDFPIVRIHDGHVSGWLNEVGGASCLVTDGTHAALLGGYGPDRDRIVGGTLTEETFDAEGQARLVLNDGTDLPPSFSWVARGAQLHVFAEATWYTASIDELLHQR